MADAAALLRLIDFDAIAAEWRDVVMPSAFADFTAVEMHAHLAGLARDVTALLVVEPYDSRDGQEQGRRLARLHLLRGDELGQTMRILTRAWEPLLGAEEGHAVVARGPLLIGDIVHGFFDSSVEIILDEQETIRRAQLQTLDRLHHDLAQQRDQLQEANSLLERNMRERARVAKRLEESEERFRWLFQNSPVALWLLDGSQTALRLKALQEQGVGDLRRYLAENPEEHVALVRSIVELAINQQARNLDQGTHDFGFRYGEHTPTRHSVWAMAADILEAIADGRTNVSGPLDVTTMAGERRQTLYYWSVPAEDKESCARMILSVVDITAQKEAEEELRQASERLQTVHDVLTAVLAAESTQAIAAAALEHLARIMIVKSAAVSLLDERFQNTIYLAGYNTPAPPGTRVPIREPEQLARFRQDQVLLVPDLTQISPARTNLRELAEGGGRSLLTVPLRARGELIGFITLISADVDAFGSKEIAITREIGASVAIALQNAALLETEQQARNVAETMRAVAARLGSSLNQKEVLDVVLSQLAAVLQFDGASILLYEGRRLELVATRGRGADPLFEHAAHLHEIPNLRRIVAEQSPLLIRDTAVDPDWIYLPGREYIRCWLGVPLLAQGSLQGILTLDKAEPAFYDEEALSLAQAFAAQAGVALANARLYQQVQASARQLRRAVTERTRELNALYDIAAVTSRYFDLQTLLKEALQLTLREFGCANAAVLTLDESDRRLLLLSEHNLSETQRTFFADVAPADLGLPPLNTLTEPTIISDLKNAAEPAAAALAGLACCLAAVPLRTQGKTLGLLILLSEETRELSDQEIRLLASHANHMAIAVENARLRKESEKLAVLHERERLAHDLHDSATQSLYSLTLFAAAARTQLRAGDLRQAEQYLDEVNTTADQAHREVRLLLHELNLGEAQEPGLVKALYRRVRAVEGRSGIATHLSVPDNLALPPKTEVELYRIASEAMTNALKHARAANIGVDIVTGNGRLTLTIADDGRGFERHSASHGLGLLSMQQRARALNGTCRIDTAPQEGTRVTVIIPYAPPGRPAKGETIA